MAIGAGVATSGSTAKLLIETLTAKKTVDVAENINSRGKLTITTATRFPSGGRRDK
jgi:hypothetical protein